MLNRRTFIQKLALGTGAGLTLGASLCLPSCTAKTKKLVILHTNDVHSHIEAFPRDYKFPNTGGFARRASEVASIRQQESNVLLLDAGDVFQGTPYFNFFKGEIEYKLMNRLKYDAGTLGNHEFDNGLEGLVKAMSFAKFPLVVSNYQFENQEVQRLFKQTLILYQGELKIGVIGLGVRLDNLVSPLHCKGITYLDPLPIAQTLSKHLKDQEKCDLVIALSHLGYSYEDNTISDRVIAEETEHIDVIIGGHTHTLLPQAVPVLNKRGKEVYIGQTGWGGTHLGRIDLTIT